jgi:hypothetical protein
MNALIDRIIGKNIRNIEFHKNWMQCNTPLQYMRQNASNIECMNVCETEMNVKYIHKLKCDYESL